MEQAPQLVKDKIELIDYKAFIDFGHNKKKSPRFRIILGNGVSYGCSYVHLINWKFTPPHSLMITTSSHIFVIEGKNLKEIETALLDEKIKELHEFNSEIHKAADSSKAIIEKINIVEDEAVE